MENEKPGYNTWIRTKNIILFLILTFISISGIFFCIYSLWSLFFIIPFPLNNKKVLGCGVIIVGIKK
ncbi:MAG: hypothetical protein JXB88_15185 [Spirochaetales bacterium]|nr:hypothetical protein [Spirochaetales bacterium]